MLPRVGALDPINNNNNNSVSHINSWILDRLDTPSRICMSINMTVETNKTTE